MFLADAARLEEATEQAQQAVVVGDALVASDPKNATARNTLAQSFSQLGKCHLQSAAIATTTSTERRKRLVEAKNAYQASLQTWTALRDAGALPAADGGKIDEVGRDIALCDGELTRAAAE